jgi:tRNA G18 (ribose-2'-O)-methylase SpoU
MSKLKIRTAPDLSQDSPAHQQAKIDGPEHFQAWQYNVADRFKSHTVEEIKQELQRTAHPFAVCFENWIGDFNMSSGIRNANAFNAKEVFYLGDKKWDKRGAQGVYNYTEVKWLPTIDDFIKLKERYVIVGVDNVAGACSLRYYHWPRNTLMVFGSEGTGLTPEMQSMCKDIVAIDQFGSVRSLNCGTASGIIMYEFVKQFRAGQVL